MTSVAADKMGSLRWMWQRRETETVPLVTVRCFERGVVIHIHTQEIVVDDIQAAEFIVSAFGTVFPGMVEQSLRGAAR